MQLSSSASSKHVHLDLKPECSARRAAFRRQAGCDRQVTCQALARQTEACTLRHIDSVGSRRHVLLSAAAAVVAGFVTGASPARADIVYDAVRSSVRPETDEETAVITLLDARGTLLELQKLAATPADSQERFRARRLLPGMAKRLRELGPSVPGLVALVSGSGRDADYNNGEAQLSREYGGTGGEGFEGGAVPLYIAIGNVITISGRTIQRQAQASPNFAEAAATRIDELLAALPQNLVARAKDIRAKRTA